MANDLKAVVSVTADTSGLIRGVDGAMQKLNSISKNTSLMAGMTAAQQVFGALQQLWTAISNRSEELGKLAVQFSPEAMSAAAQRSIAELQANQQIGQALGPYQAGIEGMRAASATAEASRIAAQAEQIGEGMIVVQSLMDQSKVAWNEMLDAILVALGVFSQPEKMIQAIGENPMGAANAGAWQLLGFGAAGSGVDYTLNAILETMTTKIGGD